MESKAALAAVNSGAVSAWLGLLFPGGAQALNNPATRETARRGLGSVMGVFLKGGAKEVPQELVDSGSTTSRWN